VKAKIDQTSALLLMQDNPAIIKRPILKRDGRFYIGFNPPQYQEIFTPA
jgi:arsenate reductase-like glutaredoxin family protein